MFDTEMLEQRRDDLEPGVDALGEVDVGGPAETGTIRADDADVVVFGEVVFADVDEAAGTVSWVSDE